MGTEGVIHNNKLFDRDLIDNIISSQHTSFAMNDGLRLLLFAYNILDPDSQFRTFGSECKVRKTLYQNRCDLQTPKIQQSQVSRGV